MLLYLSVFENQCVLFFQKSVTIFLDMYRVIRMTRVSLSSSFARKNSYSSKLSLRNLATPQLCTKLYKERLTIISSNSSLSYGDKQLALSMNNDIVDKINFRHSVEDDIKHLEKMVQEEGWWYSSFEYSVLLKLDPFSITVATDDNDTPVGFLGICNVLPGTAYNGPFIVRNDYRGTGIGNVFKRAMHELMVDRNGCMDIDYEYVEKYTKEGFIHKSYTFKSFRIVINNEFRDKKKADNSCIVPVTDELFPFILDYDRGVYKGLDRERILRSCLFSNHVHSVAAICDGLIKGYGSLVKSNENTYSISTLFADNEKVVEDILGNLLDLVPNGATLFALLISDKRLSGKLSGVETVWPMQRLYNKFTIETDIDRMYYVNDFML